MKTWRVHVLLSPEARAEGATRFPEGMPENAMLVFPNANPGEVVHMRGVNYPLQVIFLDVNLKPLYWRLMRPGETTHVLDGTTTVVEFSANAAMPDSFEFLRKAIPYN